MTSNPRKTPQQWTEIVARFHASGLIQHEFCTEQGIGSSTLDKWKKRVAETVRGQSTAAPFIRVHAVVDADGTTVTLQTAHGVSVCRFQSSCPVDLPGNL